MPPSSKKSCLALLREIAGITQKQLAQLIDCAPVTVQSVELGKLKLSLKLAKRIALQTGVSREWLLQDNYKSPPTSAWQPGEPFTRRMYEMTRAEICDPRTDPADLFQAEALVAGAAHQLLASFLAAYRRNQTTLFFYKMREWREEWVVDFPPAKDLDPQQTMFKMWRQFHRLLAQAAASKRS